MWLLIPSIILGTVLLFQAYASARDGANRAYDRLLDASSRVLAEQVKWQQGHLWFDVPASALDMLAPNEERVFYTLVDNQGRFVSGNVELPALPRRSLPDTHSYEFAAATIEFEGMPLRLGVRRARLSDWDRNDHFEIRVAHTMESRQQLTRALIEGSMLRFAGISLIAIAAAFAAIRAALLPLRRLRHAIKARSAHDLSPLALPVPHEVRELVNALNELLARQRQARAHQQRFIGDASHQLRTPLAGLSARAELALRSQDPTHWREALTAMLATSNRAARLASQLLSLTRLQANETPAEKRPVRIDLLARNALNTTLAHQRHRTMDFGLELPESPVIVMAMDWQLEEALANLIDNATRYGAQRITLGVTAMPPALWVEDDGLGIALDKRREVLRPFYRGQEDGQGSGLGLSIVASIVEAHGATLHLLSGADGKGLRAIIEFSSTDAEHIL
ncbi:sensor histidine kinase [Phytohalomonas tamaricis]|uniref:sensor histidine kinase n=1 Tax=Phytohalomonas tamaricis TaxID=2081032 RepID=UPI0021D44390|nr:sensor histidine kinase [Phytohalomonas tamaricis]